MLSPSLDHCYWLEACNTAFVYLPKVACTSWKIFLTRALHGGLPEGLNYQLVHSPEFMGLPLVATMTSDKRIIFCDQIGKSISLVAMMREPRERILSAYLDKFISRVDRQFFSTLVRPAIQDYHAIPRDRMPSFLQFLQWMDGSEHFATHNAHWRPMSHLLGITVDNKDFYDYLWRLDQIDEASAELNRRLRSNVSFPSFHALGPRPPSGSSERLDDYFSDRYVQELFSKIYQADLDLYAAIA